MQKEVQQLRSMLGQQKRDGEIQWKKLKFQANQNQQQQWNNTQPQPWGKRKPAWDANATGKGEKKQKVQDNRDWGNHGGKDNNGKNGKNGGGKNKKKGK